MIQKHLSVKKKKHQNRYILNYFERILHGPFTCLVFRHKPTLGEVIRAAEWGSNRDIRQRGFRVDTEFSILAPFFGCKVKQMEIIHDPKMEINHNTAIVSLKGDRVIVVRLEEKEWYSKS